MKQPFPFNGTFRHHHATKTYNVKEERNPSPKAGVGFHKRCLVSKPESGRICENNQAPRLVFKMQQVKLGIKFKIDNRSLMFLIENYTVWKLIVMGQCFLLPYLPAANLFKAAFSFKQYPYLWECIYKKAEDQVQPTQIRQNSITFSLPSIIVTKLYKTWKTAKKNMRMCNSCNPSVDISGSCPWREETISYSFRKTEIYVSTHTTIKSKSERSFKKDQRSE